MAPHLPLEVKTLIVAELAASEDWFLRSQKGKTFGSILQVWPDILWEVRKRRFRRIQLNAGRKPTDESPLYTVDGLVDIIRGEPGILPLVHHLDIPGRFLLMSYSGATKDLMGIYSHPEFPMLMAGMTNLTSLCMEINVPNLNVEQWDNLLGAFESCKNLKEVRLQKSTFCELWELVDFLHSIPHLESLILASLTVQEFEHLVRAVHDDEQDECDFAPIESEWEDCHRLEPLESLRSIQLKPTIWESGEWAFLDYLCSSQKTFPGIEAVSITLPRGHLTMNGLSRVRRLFERFNSTLKELHLLDMKGFKDPVQTALPPLPIPNTLRVLELGVVIYSLRSVACANLFVTSLEQHLGTNPMNIIMDVTGSADYVNCDIGPLDAVLGNTEAKVDSLLLRVYSFMITKRAPSKYREGDRVYLKSAAELAWYERRLEKIVKEGFYKTWARFEGSEGLRVEWMP